MKRLFIGLVIVLVPVLAVGAFLWFSSALNEMAEVQIEAIGSEATQTLVSVDDVDISLFTGRGELRGLRVPNPRGFSDEAALVVERIALHLDVGSLREDVLVLHELVVDSARLALEQQFPDVRKNNQRVLLEHLRAFAQAPGAERRWSDRLLIERLHFTEAEVVLRVPVLGEKRYAVPDVEAQDIGRETVGVTVSEAPLRILEPLLTQVLKVMAGQAAGS